MKKYYLLYIYEKWNRYFFGKFDLRIKWEKLYDVRYDKGYIIIDVIEINKIKEYYMKLCGYKFENLLSKM